MSVKLGFRLQKAVLEIPDSLWLTKIQGFLLSSPHSTSEAVINLGTKGRWNLTPTCQDKNLNSLCLIYEKKKEKRWYSAYTGPYFTASGSAVSCISEIKSFIRVMWGGRVRKMKKSKGRELFSLRSAAWQCAFLPIQANNFRASFKWFQKLFRGWCSWIILLKLLGGYSITVRNLLSLL